MSREDQAIEMWTRGDYAIVGDWFAAASRQVLDTLPITPGIRLLDVACGTGAVAIEAARRGGRVVGLDLTPAMLQEAQRRAEKAGVPVTWKQGSFQNLRHLGQFDVVTSAFGVMFARDPQQVAAELVSVCTPGGHIATVAWHEDGAFGSGSPAIKALLQDLPTGPDVTRWSHRDDVMGFFENTPATLIQQQRHTMAIGFDSIDEAFRQLRAHSGPWQMVLEYLDSRGVSAQAEAAIKEHLRRYATTRPDGRIDLQVAYAISTLQRKAED
ncbi:MAG: class I SAM-dependent methyltransferase [Myxococcota bacterium]